MPPSYDEALSTLYRAPHEAFVAERKRLSAELKTAGDASGAAKLGKLARPPISAWAVNQLWWDAREAFEELFEAAERVRQGDLGATAEHRGAIADLRARAFKVLRDAGHSTSEATLRRVTATLSALAVAGGFDPDPPGALASDRDPPGFEAWGSAELTPEVALGGSSDPARRSDAESAAAARAKAEAEERRREAEEERARREAERKRLEAAVAAAKHELEARLRETERLERELAEAGERRSRAQAALLEAESRLGELDEGDLDGE